MSLIHLMQKAQKSVCAVLAALSVSVVASAADFGAADALFARRAEGPAVIEQAKDAYAAQLASADRSQKLYAVDRLSRLAYYQGLITPESASEQRKSFFKRCWDDLENIIGPAALGENPEYYYWKGVCMAQWAKANGIASSLSKSGELVRTLEKGIQIDPTFEGGGFYRLGAAVYQNLPPVNPFGPTYDINKSLEWANSAIASPAYPGSENPDNATGDYFYNVYEYRSVALDRKGDRSGALATVKGAISRIEQGDIAPDREPETAAILQTLKDLADTLN
jgi:hypothetical protein